MNATELGDAIQNLRAETRAVDEELEAIEAEREALDKRESVAFTRQRQIRTQIHNLIFVP